MRKSFLLVPLTLAMLAAFPSAHAQYQMPPVQLQAIVDAPRAPTLSISPKRNLASMVESPALPSIAEVAQPELKLAGLRINPRTYSPSRFSFGTNLKLLEIETGKQIQVNGLPKSLRLAASAWSPDQRYLAFTHVALADKEGASGVEVWIVDVATKNAKRLTTQPLSYLNGNGMDWLPDSKGLLVTLKPAKLGKAPVSNGFPAGPSLQDSQKSVGHVSRCVAGTKRQARPDRNDAAAFLLHRPGLRFPAQG